MRWRPDRYGALRSLLGGRAVAEEVSEELEQHIAERTAANIARGMTAVAAREDALRRFGDVERFRRETERIDESIEREARRMEIVGTLRRELRQAWRGLRRSPGFAIVAVLTLALGIGASAAVYTLLHRVVLEPLPYPAAERLVRIDHPVPGIQEGQAWSLSTASFVYFREQARSLDDVAVYWPNRSNVRTGESAIMGDVVQVSANLFDLLGARAATGRLLLPSDDEPDATRVAVLSHGYWERELGGDPRVVGTTLELEGAPVEIVGIAERDFQLPEQPADVYVARRIAVAGPHYNWHHLSAIGRLAPGVALPAAQAELATLTSQLADVHPGVYNPDFIERSTFGVRLRDLREAVVGDTARVLWIVLGSVMLVLLIACANVANLFLVRSEARQNELTIRSALGATRGHLVVQAFSDAILLCILAGAVGLLLAQNGVKLVVTLAPTALPRVTDAGLAWQTVAFVLALVLLSACVFALFPLLRRIDWSLLREGARGSTASRRQLRVRGALVTAQIALAVILLSGTGLMLRSFDQLRRVDLGVEADNLLVVPISLPSARYNDGWDPSVAFWRDLSQRVAELPGVQQVGTTTTVPLLETPGCAVLVNNPSGAEGGGLGCVPNVIITPGYFEALGIPVTGRTPTWNDVQSGTGAIVISRALAHRIWPGEDAIGRGIRVPNVAPDEGRWYEIVGVTGDVHMEGAEKPPTQVVYYPVRPIEGAPLWGRQTAMWLLVRTSGTDPLQLASPVRQIVREMEPAAAISELRTMEQVVQRSMARTSFIMTLIGIAGVMALVLSIVGLYGVIAYTVGLRRGEIGVRMALGAHASTVGGMIVLESLRLSVIGVLLGLIGAAATTGALRSLLFGVDPTDGLTLTVVAGLLLVIAAAASLIPARRAARVDPVESLKA
jgi:putative ABC transport system permease protein